MKRMLKDVSRQPSLQVLKLSDSTGWWQNWGFAPHPSGWSHAKCCLWLLKKADRSHCSNGWKDHGTGKPSAKKLEPGTPYDVAFERAVNVIREVCELAGELGVILAVEPLSPVETSFLSSCQEARRFIAAVNRPACRLHLDIKAMAHETAARWLLFMNIVGSRTLPRKWC